MVMPQLSAAWCGAIGGVLTDWSTGPIDSPPPPSPRAAAAAASACSFSASCGSSSRHVQPRLLTGAAAARRVRWHGWRPRAAARERTLGLRRRRRRPHPHHVDPSAAASSRRHRCLTSAGAGRARAWRHLRAGTTRSRHCCAAAALSRLPPPRGRQGRRWRGRCPRPRPHHGRRMWLARRRRPGRLMTCSECPSESSRSRRRACHPRSRPTV